MLKLLARLALLPIAAGPAGAALAAPKSLSDADVLAYFNAPFDQAAMMNKHVVVGINRGAAVVADFPCSDSCPADTTRLIHYDFAPGPACAKVGGIVQKWVLGPKPTAFCVPKALEGYQGGD